MDIFTSDNLIEHIIDTLCVANLDNQFTEKFTYQLINANRVVL